MNVAEILQTRAVASPSAIALIDTHRRRSRRLTFHELEQAVGQTASLFHHSGLRPGDTVLVFHRMSAELYLALAAIFRLGMVAMFVDPSAGREHIRRCCAMRLPQGFIASSKAHWLRLLSAELRRIPVKFFVGPPVPGAISLQRAKRQPYRHAIQPCTDETGALLTFTSGSTAEPKAALRTHGFLLAQHQAIEQSLGLTPGEIDLCTQPVFVLANLASGVTSLIPNIDLRRPDSINPSNVVNQILKHSATRATASPAFYERLIAYCSDREITLTCLKKIFAGGGLVPPRLMDELRRIAPQSTVTAVYGSTEVEPIANVSNWEISKKDVAAMSAGQGVLAGLPAPMTHVRIMKTNGCRNVSRTYTCSEFEADCLNSGQAGEIVVSGQHVLSGYLSGANDDANKFNVETTRWHRTGDMGCFDQRGRLWLLGRCSARIEDQHGTLFPFAVEAGALQHEFVRRAAAVSIGGRRILALEVHNGPLHKPQVELLFETLSYANIHKVHVLDRMPVDQRHNSRIDYPALTSLLEKSM